jgi:hypothetical protein
VQVQSVQIEYKSDCWIAKRRNFSKRAELLFRITDYFKPETILEIGTFRISNFSTFLGNFEAKKSPHWKVVLIE